MMASCIRGVGEFKVFVHNQQIVDKRRDNGDG